MDPIEHVTPRSTTLAELRASGWRSRTVKEELRANLLARLASGGQVFPGIVGYEERSSRPSRTRSSPARTSSSSASAARPRRGWRGCSSACSTVAAGRRAAASSTTTRTAPISPAARAIVERDGDATADRLAPARPPLRREAGDAGHHHRRPDRRGRPDQGRRGPLPVRRADAPLRPDPARQPRDLRDQRAARPRRADPGRPAQHPRGARRPDPRLQRPAAARPVRGRLGQPGGLHHARPDHHAAQGPPRVADPDALPADARARDGDRPPGEASLRGGGGDAGRGRARRSWRSSSPS